MSIVLILPGSIKSKKNSKRVFPRKGKKGYFVLPSEAYVKWEETAREDLIWRCNPTPTDKKVEVKVTAYYKGQHPDLSGVLESVGDCLEGLAWVNDKQIVSWDGSRLVHDKVHPRTIVEIKVIE